jgi:hypothetical protein
MWFCTRQRQMGKSQVRDEVSKWKRLPDPVCPPQKDLTSLLSWTQSLLCPAVSQIWANGEGQEGVRGDSRPDRPL